MSPLWVSANKIQGFNVSGKCQRSLKESSPIESVFVALPQLKAIAFEPRSAPKK
ncbi:hypothetical protein H6F74_03885 [Trichocoleus sp. FACHB-90]|uniref:hypothetical protein n=1 Tax=Cyanophyceae TaxID=3028117 RepID=UPI001688BFAC|nr:hypothetical protein [Trichocoleus sp. FACHB-90]MBD1925430.1 hypothetical protein [Trichocoleus sp. FACHB-90]